MKTEQEQWQAYTRTFVAEANAYHEATLRDGYDESREFPNDPRDERLVRAAIDAVRKANKTGNTASLREMWPPAHAPLIEPFLQENGQPIPVVCILPDDSIVARVGDRTIHIKGDTVSNVDSVGFFGRCPNRRYFAIWGKKAVTIVDGWMGPQVATCQLPTGLEDIPEGIPYEPPARFSTPTRLIPFPDGKRVLIVSADGVYVSSPDDVKRLLPTNADLLEGAEFWKEEFPGETMGIGLSMEHGAISKDGKWIVVGHQDSTHLIFNDKLELVGNIGNRMDYPHYALFSADSSMIALNSCHFYSGETIGLPVSLLPGITTPQYEEDDRLTTLEDHGRVYAGASRDDEFIIGEAHGFVLAFDTKGQRRWYQFIGSTVGDMDLSPDGKTLAVSTYAGFLSIIRLDTAERSPYQIGMGNQVETRRWIFWANEPAPLIW